MNGCKPPPIAYIQALLVIVGMFLLGFAFGQVFVLQRRKQKDSHEDRS